MLEAMVFSTLAYNFVKDYLSSIVVWSFASTWRLMLQKTKVPADRPSPQSLRHPLPHPQLNTMNFFNMPILVLPAAIGSDGFGV